MERGMVEGGRRAEERGEQNILLNTAKFTCNGRVLVQDFVLFVF